VLEDVKNSQEYRLVAKAHILYDEMVGERAASSQAFVAMWFDPQMKDAYDKGFELAITGAGYSPLRIDRKEHDGKIDDQIIAEIRRSAFVVADFTEHRGGVYYEAGFAHGLGRHVIFTCQRDHLSKLHFDVRQYITILWDKPSDVVAPLQNRILALFGAGPLKPDARSIPV
jgi:nucleoside 2-deoxyribosyltransferase